jgi:hypothetical protein
MESDSDEAISSDNGSDLEEYIEMELTEDCE